MKAAQTDPASPNQPVYFTGTSGWTYDHWKGRFYPDSLAKKAWFDYYASQFSSVEVNATFYRTFKDQTYHNWRRRAPQGFGYVLKAPQLITHRKYLLDVEENIQAFYHSCSLLEEKFEMILLQVAPNTPYDLERLNKALLAFPDPTRVAVEFRRADWLNQDTLSLLRSAGATICNVDSPEHTLSDHLTSNRAYLRLHGRKHWYAYNYSEDELREMADLARKLAQRGASRVYIFFNNDFESYAPANALEACLATLEGGQFGLAFASGMAAIDAVLHLLAPGDHVLASNDVYGGTYRLFEQVLRPYGLDFSYVDTTDLELVISSLRPNTRMVCIESPSNPLLRVSDITALVKVAHNHFQPIFVVVDNTFATPYLQRPLVLGADLVVHSTTKYLGGHSDVVGGAIIGRDETVRKQLAFLQNAVGAVPGPMDCFLILRGIKTLAVRMDRHAENATKVANFLAAHPKVSHVYYPFLASHPQVELARRQMRSGGGMVSFILKGGAAEAIRVAESTHLFTLAESLGGVESLIEVPAAMTHASTAHSPLAVSPDLVRLSVGIENVDDLIADLSQALE